MADPVDLLRPFAAMLVVTEAAAATALGLSLRTMQRLRQAGEGPAFVRLSERRIAYRPADLDRWLAARATGAPPPGLRLVK